MLTYDAVVGKRYGRFRLPKFRTMSIAPGLLVAFLLAGCSGNGSGSVATSPAPSTTHGQLSTTPTPLSSGAIGSLCRDLAAIRKRLPAILTRLSTGQESKQRYGEDQIVIDALSQQLYADASVFALAGREDVFELANRLSSHLNRLVYGYFMYEDPSQIDPSVVPLVHQDLDDVSSELGAGLLPCPEQ
jgi:hypothetical protein